MPLKQYKATSPVRRFRQSASFDELTKGKKPERSLTERKLSHAGRNAQGRVTTRHRGGGEKRNYRIVDFKRDKDGIPATVKAIEYDPNRSARLALLFYKDGEKRYIIAPVDLRVGDSVVSGFYSEGSANVTLSMLLRTNQALTQDFPITSYLENVGVRPDVPADYMTEANLLNRGKPFVDAFSAAAVALIK